MGRVRRVGLSKVTRALEAQLVRWIDEWPKATPARQAELRAKIKATYPLWHERWVAEGGRDL